MRLIDADALADALFEKRKNYPQWVADTIGVMPTIDVDVLLKEQGNCENCAMAIEDRKIVRCKDCKFGEPWGVLIGCGTAKGFGITHKPDWFCADGEKRE